MSLAHSEAVRAKDGPVVRRLLPLNLIILLGFMTVAIPLPVLPLLVHATITTSPAVAGLVVGMQSIATVLTRRYAGTIADTAGPRTSTLRGLAICMVVGVVYIVAVVVPTAHALGLMVLLIARVLLGFGESLILTGAITWGIGRVGPEHSGQVMSWNGIAMYGALAFGAPVGLAVFTHFATPSFGFLAIATATFILSLLAFLIAMTLPDAQGARGEQISTLWMLRRIWPFGAALTLQMVGFGTIASFLSLTFGSLGWRGAGLGFTGFGVSVIAVRLIGGRLPDRFGGKVVALVSLVIEVCGQGLIWLAPSSMVADAGAAVTGAGVALAFPALGIEAMKRVPPTSRGLVVGVFSAFQDVAFGLTGPLTGFIVIIFGYRSAFAAGAVSAVIAMTILLLVAKRLET